MTRADTQLGQNVGAILVRPRKNDLVPTTKHLIMLGYSYAEVFAAVTLYGKQFSIDVSPSARHVRDGRLASVAARGSSLSSRLSLLNSMKTVAFSIPFSISTTPVSVAVGGSSG